MSRRGQNDLFAAAKMTKTKKTTRTTTTTTVIEEVYGVGEPSARATPSSHEEPRPTPEELFKVRCIKGMPPFCVLEDYYTKSRKNCLQLIRQNHPQGGEDEGNEQWVVAQNATRAQRQMVAGLPAAVPAEIPTAVALAVATRTSSLALPPPFEQPDYRTYATQAASTPLALPSSDERPTKRRRRSE